MSSDKLFIWNRPLPAPFDTANKKVKVASIYAGGSTEATLNATVLKALLAYCKCSDGSMPGAVGQADVKTVAEYKSGVDADTYHLVTYDPGSGNVMAGVYNKNTEVMEQYTLHKDKRDGAAVIMAMIPTCLMTVNLRKISMSLTTNINSDSLI